MQPNVRLACRSIAHADDIQRVKLFENNMPRICLFAPRLVLLVATLCCFVVGACVPTRAQSTSQSSPQSDDVVRVNTELVQTDVMVFDRRGNFVDGLRPDQFILNLNGEKRALAMLSRVSSGSRDEANQLAAARAGKKLPLPSGGSPSNTTHTGRLIYFFVDDLHLSAEGIERSRKALINFIDRRINPEDQVAIVSSSGQIGFLQQLTDSQSVMRSAINRLNYKKNSDATEGRTRITEYMASQIEDGHNRELFAYLMESVKLEFGMGLGALRGDHKNDSGGQAARVLKNRLAQITAQNHIDALNTLRVLQALMESSASIPGRKLVFFLSDGFVIDSRGSNALDLLHQVTRVAAKTGAVIYTMDTRGNFLDGSVDVSNNDYVDMTSRHAGVSMGETTEPRQPLSLMADETGGRAIFNSSSIDNAIRQAVDETAEYYVLAWRPESENERKGTSKIEITVAGRPELRVRLRRSYVALPPPTRTTDKVVPTTPDAQLIAALGSSYSLRTLPIFLSVGYLKNSADDFKLQASMQIDRRVFGFADKQSKSELDVIGAAIDDRGLIYSFKQLVTVIPQEAENSSETAVVWAQQLLVRPGLYQVRIAVRERGSGRTGSASQWIEVPNAGQDRLAMSSLFLGERGDSSELGNDRGPTAIRVDVDHHFARSSVLRFQTYVYNAPLKAAAPDIWIEAQVLRGREQVMSVPARQVPRDPTASSNTLPYWSEISLLGLAPGTYTLQVEAKERLGNRTALQTTNFMVE